MIEISGKESDNTMITKDRNHYLEKVTHLTGDKSYSLYRIAFSGAFPQALYLHMHPEAEFLYLESGRLDFYIEDQNYILEAGDAVFIPPNLLHYANTAEDTSGVFHALVFSPEFVISPLEQELFAKYIPTALYNMAYVCILRPEENWQKELLHELETIFLASEKNRTDFLFMRGRLLLIWHLIYHNHIAATASDNSEKGYLNLQASIHYIHTHYAEELSLSELADTAHMSTGYFCRSFRQLTGYAPFTYLKRYRILKSCSFLSGTNMKIGEVCLLCGFNNISYYNREFQKLMKMTPSEYRKMVGEIPSGN